MKFMHNHSVCMQLILVICYVTVQSIANQFRSTDDIEKICLDNHLIVKGTQISTSDVIEADCWGTAQYIEVFATDTITIDADIVLEGRNARIKFVAPGWAVAGERIINLNGFNGSQHFPLNASDGIGTFRHGKPGYPGQSGGIFFGYGETFDGTEKLTICANGGRGKFFIFGLLIL